MAACPPKSVHFQVAEGHTIGLPFYSGHPALHPSGQLKLFKIDPVNLVLVTSFGTSKRSNSCTYSCINYGVKQSIGVRNNVYISPFAHRM